MKNNKNSYCEERKARRGNLLAIAFIMLMLASCTTTGPTNFYNLNSYEIEKAQPIINKKIVIGVDSVNVAGYLDRPQIVTIKGATELHMSEFNRWAEPLSYSMQRVIAENISSHMKTGMAKPMNTSSRGYDYVVLVELNKFDGKFDNQAELDAWWTITDGSGKILARERTQLTTALGGSYADLVQKQNELLAQMSKQIAQKIGKLK